MQGRVVLMAVLCATQMVAAAHADVALRAEIHSLGTLGGRWSEAFGINESGQVVGWSETAAGDILAFVWTDGRMTPLQGLRGALRSRANAINEAGQILGHSVVIADLPGGPQAVEHALLWNGAASTNINSAMGTYYSYGLDLNDEGVVVGEADQEGFVWTPEGGREVIRIPARDSSTVRAINNAGTAVGDSFFFGDANDAMRATRRPEGGWQIDHIGPAGDHSYGIAFDINDVGVAVGGASFGLSPAGHAAVFTGRVLQDGEGEGTTAEDWYRDLGTLHNYPQSEATGINNAGWVIGWSWIMQTELPWRAFVWPGQGPLVDLNDLAPREAGWDVLYDAWDINDQGQIVGAGLRQDGSIHAFLMTLSQACAADRNGDGRTNVHDLLSYLGAYRLGDADMDGDRDTDVDDLLAYLGAYRAGC